MIKKKVPGMTNKDILQANAKNRLHHFILDEGHMRGAVIHGTHMINEIRTNHNLGILETMVLGQAYLAAALMTANLKEYDRMSFKIECAGPITGLNVEANARGEVRGHLKRNPIPIDKPLESADLSPLFGSGYISVTRYPEYAKHPFVGQVALKYGSIAKDMANYYLTSEQTPTAFNLSVKFDAEGNVIGAGGLILQTLPEADDKRLDVLEQVLLHLPSLGETFAGDQDPADFISYQFEGFKPKILGNRRVEFFCPCRKETIGKLLTKVTVDTLEDMLENGPLPVETHCHNCNTYYYFEKEEIEGFLKQAKSATQS